MQKSEAAATNEPYPDEETEPTVDFLFLQALRVAERHGFVRADAEDCAATFVQKHFADLQAGHTAGWWAVCLRNFVRDERRRAARAEQFQISFDFIADLPVTDPAPTPEDLLIRQDRTRRLYLLVERLKPEWRDCVTAHYLEGRDVADVAAAPGKSEAATRMLLSRAVARLKELRKSGGREADEL